MLQHAFSIAESRVATHLAGLRSIFVHHRQATPQPGAVYFSTSPSWNVELACCWSLLVLTISLENFQSQAMVIRLLNPRCRRHA